MTDSEFSYYLIVSDVDPKENPYALVRVRGPLDAYPDEEFFSPRLVWERSTIINRIDHGSMDRELMKIPVREVEHYMEVLTRRFNTQRAAREG